MSAAGPEREGGARSGWREWLPYVLTALAVLLAWQIVAAFLVVRAPPAVALTVAPGSALALRRAAEAELAAKETEDAQALAAEALARAPFDARALRTYGMGVAESGDLDRADQLITLVGNWSLRDDQAHAWLIDRRLRQGRYGSAFAHADTLARRREGQQPQVFRLYSTAAKADPRALGAVVNLLATRPPWRSDYLTTLENGNDNGLLLANLALGLERTAAPFTEPELVVLYASWLKRQQVPGLKEIRRRLSRPPADVALPNASFERPEGPTPFDWMLPDQPGLTAQITADDLRPGRQALRVEYDGRSPGRAAEQLLMLEPGRYVFSGNQRAEAGGAEPRLRWLLSCYETGSDVIDLPVAPSRAGDRWETFQTSFSVPATNCTAQWLRLMPRAGDRRAASAVWFDDLAIRAAP